MQKLTVLITGATDGIGKETARALVSQGHHVIVHGRVPARVQKVTQELGAAEGVTADLSSFDEVRRLGTTLAEKLAHLDVLLNNAGMFAHDLVVTGDELETTLQVNHFSHFLLTMLLKKPLLAARAARVVNVASMAHMGGHVDLDDLRYERGYDGHRAYADSKVMNILFTRALARRLPAHATTNSLHPGVIATKLLRTGFGSGGAPLERGITTSLYVATSPELDGVTGEYFSDSKKGRISSEAQNDKLAESLWRVSEAVTGSHW